MKVLFIYPEFPDTFWSFKHALKFVHKKASSPPLGLLTIASMLPSDWEKRLIDLNIEKCSDQDLGWADVVMISAMVIQRNSTKELIQRCKKEGKMMIAGGPLFTGEYEQFPEIDHFILNEAEITLPPFLKDFAEGKAKKVYSTSEYADISTTPAPMWSLVKKSHYDSMSMQFSRGCPYQCDFCNVTALLGHKPRVKSAQQIIHELDTLYATGWRRNVFFVDDNFIGNKRILKEEILPALIEWRKDKIGCLFITEASINLSDDSELMDLMVKAGFVSVFIGIETPSEESLTECHKGQNKNRNLIDSVKLLQHKGLQVMGGFIVGFDNDNSSIFNRQIEFIQKSGIVTAMVGLLQAPYGTELYARMLREGRINEQMSGDNADGTTNIVPKMSIDLLTNGYKQILAEIYSPKGFYQRVRTFLQDYSPVKAPVKIEIQEVLALFRSIFLIGILGKERRQYWRLFFWTLFNYPSKFPLAITLTIYGYHFRKVSEEHIFNVAAA